MRRLLDFVASGSLLSSAQAEEIMQELLDGQLQTPEIVQFLRALMRGPFARKNWWGLHERCAGVLRRYSEKAKFCRNGWWTRAEPAATIPEHLTFRRQRRLWLPQRGRA